MTARKLTPEILDELPPDSAAALRSRRDLWLLNRIMRHGRALRAWIDTARGTSGNPFCLADLGAGDGKLAASLIEHSEGPPGRIILVDRQPCVAPETVKRMEARGWVVVIAAQDVFGWLAHAPFCDAVVTNLFLHHFPDDSLRHLLTWIAEKSRSFAAVEPRRCRLSAAACRLLPLIRCDAVTRHDARVSVEAGFRERELSSLWPSGSLWHLSEKSCGLFSHWFSARRSA